MEDRVPFLVESELFLDQVRSRSTSTDGYLFTCLDIVAVVCQSPYLNVVYININLENYRKSILVELADRVHLGEHVLCRAVTDVKEKL